MIKLLTLLTAFILPLSSSGQGNQPYARNWSFEVTSRLPLTATGKICITTWGSPDHVPFLTPVHFQVQNLDPVHSQTCIVTEFDSSYSDPWHVSLDGFDSANVLIIPPGESRDLGLMISIGGGCRPWYGGVTVRLQFCDSSGVPLQSYESSWLSVEQPLAVTSDSSSRVASSEGLTVPNPCDASFTFQSHMIANKITRIDVFDRRGRRMFGKQLMATVSGSITIPTATLAAGTYEVLIRSEGVKFLKNIDIVR